MRGLIVDELNYVLLALLEFPTRSVWVLPGGGVEADNTSEAPVIQVERRDYDECIACQ